MELELREKYKTWKGDSKEKKIMLLKEMQTKDEFWLNKLDELKKKGLEIEKMWQAKMKENDQIWLEKINKQEMFYEKEIMEKENFYQEKIDSLKNEKEALIEEKANV